MPSNNTKYSEEMREQTAAYIIETGKSATSIKTKIPDLNILGLKNWNFKIHITELDVISGRIMRCKFTCEYIE